MSSPPDWKSWVDLNSRYLQTHQHKRMRPHDCTAYKVKRTCSDSLSEWCTGMSSMAQHTRPKALTSRSSSALGSVSPEIHSSKSAGHTAHQRKENNDTTLASNYTQTRCETQASDSPCMRVWMSGMPRVYLTLGGGFLRWRSLIEAIQSVIFFG